jgi:hypothetical protein
MTGVQINRRAVPLFAAIPQMVDPPLLIAGDVTAVAVEVGARFVAVSAMVAGAGFNLPVRFVCLWLLLEQDSALTRAELEVGWELLRQPRCRLRLAEGLRTAAGMIRGGFATLCH